MAKTYFKINDVDFSKYVSELRIKKGNNYNAQTNAAGNTVVEYINTKREIEVGIVPVDETAMLALTAEIDKFNVKLSFLNPSYNTLEENVDCIIPENEIEYYTIQVGKTLFKAVKLTFTEL